MSRPLLPLQAEIIESMSPEVDEAAESARSWSRPFASATDMRFGRSQLLVDHARGHSEGRHDEGLDGGEDEMSVPGRESGASPNPRIRIRPEGSERFEKDRATGSWQESLSSGSGALRVGGLMPGLGECDVLLLLDDGSRLPAHSCLLLASSGAFRELFTQETESGSGDVGGARDPSDMGASDAFVASVGPTVHDSNPARALDAQSEGGGPLCPSPDRNALRKDKAARPCSSRGQELLMRARDVDMLLTGGTEPSSAQDNPTAHDAHNTGASSSGLAFDVSLVAAHAACSRRADVAGTTPPVGMGRSYNRCPDVDGSAVRWGRGRGEVLVRSWGEGVVASIVRHTYTGRPPDHVKDFDALAHLLVASASLRMPR